MKLDWKTTLWLTSLSVLISPLAQAQFCPLTNASVNGAYGYVASEAGAVVTTTSNSEGGGAGGAGGAFSAISAAKAVDDATTLAAMANEYATRFITMPLVPNCTRTPTNARTGHRTNTTKLSRSKTPLIHIFLIAITD